MNVKELFSLKGKVAIVTGGRGLYGASISEGLAEAGAQVVIASRSGAACEETAAALRARGLKASGTPLDLSDDASIARFTEETADRFGGIDILVNNAVDRRSMAPVTKVTREALRASAAVNLDGQLLLSKAVLEKMQARRSGSVVNIGSMRGLDSPHFPFYPPELREAQPINYTTEKWAMVGMTKYLAGWYGAYNIRVNCIAPGGFNPGISDTADGAAFEKTYVEHCPLHRWAGPDDIKGPVVFLASAAANYVTGAVLVMDGGWTIW